MSAGSGLQMRFVSRVCRPPRAAHDAIVLITFICEHVTLSGGTWLKNEPHRLITRDETRLGDIMCAQPRSNVLSCPLRLAFYDLPSIPATHVDCVRSANWPHSDARTGDWPRSIASADARARLYHFGPLCLSLLLSLSMSPSVYVSLEIRPLFSSAILRRSMTESEMRLCWRSFTSAVPICWLPLAHQLLCSFPCISNSLACLAHQLKRLISLSFERCVVSPATTQLSA